MLAAAPVSSPPPIFGYDGHSQIPRQRHAHAHLPPRPSPLSPRSANARLFPLSSTMSGSKPQPHQDAPSHAQKAPFSARPTRPNPLIRAAPRGGEARDARRALFLQRVARDRDDRRWAERGEQLLRLDWGRERRQWEEEKARSAPAASPEWAAEEEDQIVLSGQSERLSAAEAMETSQREKQTEREAEMVREMEEREMEGLLALMEEHGGTGASSTYGSDEDDYDGLFMELVEQDQGERRVDAVAEGDQMDTSGG